MTALMSARDGLSVELTVALEIGTILLDSATGPDAREQALVYNLSLWRCIASMAAGRPDLADCGGLARSASEVAAARCRDMLMERNRRHARMLATRFLPGALGRLLDDWRACRRGSQAVAFAAWMLDRLEGCAPPAISPT